MVVIIAITITITITKTILTTITRSPESAEFVDIIHTNGALQPAVIYVPVGESLTPYIFVI